MLMARILEQHDARVIEAANGRQAMEILRAHNRTVDLVLTDILMPEMSGLELARRLRERAAGDDARLRVRLHRRGLRATRRRAAGRQAVHVGRARAARSPTRFRRGCWPGADRPAAACSVRLSCEHVFVPYVELHAHSAFSFLDGASLPDELAAAAAEHGYEAMALTDHNGVSGSMEFAVAAEPLGLEGDPRGGDRRVRARGRARPRRRVPARPDRRSRSGAAPDAAGGGRSGLAQPVPDRHPRPRARSRPARASARRPAGGDHAARRRPRVPERVRRSRGPGRGDAAPP